jgi:hypothetical protein
MCPMWVSPHVGGAFEVSHVAFPIRFRCLRGAPCGFSHTFQVPSRCPVWVSHTFEVPSRCPVWVSPHVRGALEVPRVGFPTRSRCLRGAFEVSWRCLRGLPCGFCYTLEVFPVWANIILLLLKRARHLEPPPTPTHPLNPCPPNLVPGARGPNGRRNVYRPSRGWGIYTYIALSPYCIVFAFGEDPTTEAPQGYPTL